MSSSAALIAHFEGIAQAHHANYDSSHTFDHVQRVLRLSLAICASLNAVPSSSDSVSAPPACATLVVHLAAVAHDLVDKKYLPSGSTLTAEEHLKPLWVGYEEVITEEQRRLVERIVDNVSYSKEVKRLKNGEETEWHRTCKELHW